MKTKLRQYDRSNTRFDSQRQVFASINQLQKCECCLKSSDYSKLQSLRFELQHAVTPDQGNFCGDDDTNEVESDIDFDDFTSEFELIRKQEMQKRLSKYKQLESIGYGVHSEDSVTHLTTYLKCHTNLVIHVFSDTFLDARIDLVLEKLSTMYYGTIFRRLPTRNKSLLINTIRSLPQSTPVDTYIGEASYSGSALFCFSKGQFKAIATNLTQFGDETVVYERDLERYLDNVTCLSLQPDESVTRLYAHESEVNFAANVESDESEVEKWCDDPSCTRRFPHDHVGGKGGKSKILGVTSFGSNEKNSHSEEGRDEIFADKYLSRL